MNNEKMIENKKEDSKAFGKYAIIIVLSALIGGVIGFASAFMGEGQKTLSEMLIRGLDIVSPFAPVVLTTVVVLMDIVLEKQCRKMYRAWDGENEAIVDKIEMKLSYVLIATTIDTILTYFFFAAAMYCSGLNTVTDKASLMPELVNVAVVLGGLLYTLIAVTLIQKRVVNFEKEINPEKKGSVYDMKFQKKWLESCDEGEKLQIYKSAYKSYQVTQLTCMALWLVNVMGVISFGFGLLPVTCITIIWLVLSLSYSLETIRLSKHPSEIMK